MEKPILKTALEQEAMRLSGRLAAQLLDFITPWVKPGVSTLELDRRCHEHIVQVQHARPSPLGYAPGGKSPYPYSICTSVNAQVCHGLPNNKPLREGDIVNVDVTVEKNGFHGDSSRMFMVGKVSRAAHHLVQVAYQAMHLGIAQVKPGARLGDIGHAIQSYVEAQGCSVVRDYCGHGIGREFHEAPQVLHYGRPGTGMVLQAGMVFTIEPMVNAGSWHTRELSDGWTVVTKDRSLSAQWEHTLLVTPSGYEILTRSDEKPA